MADSSGDGNGSSTKTSQKRQRTGMLTDLDVMDCSVCFDTLTIPIFQCDNGHMACSTCCEKLRKRCATCTYPTIIRNRGMERVLELLKVPCPNAEFGCSEEVIYDEKSAHFKQCTFAQCTCPFRSCGFTGSYKDVYEHSVAKHSGEGYGYRFSSLEKFECGKPLYLSLSGGERLVLKEQTKEGGELVVVDCFKSTDGEKFSVSCIAPKTPGIGEFTCILTANSCPECDLCFTSSVKRVCKVTDEPPQEHFMLVPLCMQHRGKIVMCINRKTSKDHEGASTSSA
ncbi:hypothetical protein AALP_AA5G199400 [Arabis alpina]|uniref:RING-type E3 ubiquitin transferase n=1 Tax=Arabis alpina TaxID=50452 RepID=A0A087GY84_ARAAL|nr:hypothetical protein AALP_AA5G199400 [Arabis alpina]